LYVRAAEFEKTSAAGPAGGAMPAAAVPSGQSTEGQKINYIIQVGAFGEEENARQLQKSLQTQKFPVRIIERVVNDRNLYCVWVNGGESLDETIRLADKIKNRFKLEYRILKN
jgi:cell division septation protein DedD